MGYTKSKAPPRPGGASRNRVTALGPDRSGVQALRFLLVGGLTVALDFLLLYLLIERVQLLYLPAAAIAFSLASTANYFLSRLFVFVPGRFRRGLEFSYFIGTSVVGLGINHVLMWMFVGVVGAQYLPAKAFSIAGVTAWNYISKKKLVFQG